jgi:hypothetical protein
VKLLETNKEFALFLAKCESEASIKIGSNITLSSLMIQPCQRLPRYELLLKSLAEQTTPDHCDYEAIQNALRTAIAFNTKVNDKKANLENEATRMRIQEMIGDSLDVTMRVLVKEGKVMIQSTEEGGELSKVKKKEKIY